MFLLKILLSCTRPAFNASYPCERKNQAVFLFAAACSKRITCAANSVHAVFFGLLNQVADADGTAGPVNSFRGQFPAFFS
uniref:hypothetical protein n=1 Tax=Candidatus Electronema sp. TaxID=2698783 RepID=UPI004056561B